MTLNQKNEVQVKQQSSVIELLDGSLIVTWDSIPTGSSDGRDIYGQHLDADGNAIGNEFRVNTYTDSNQFDPNIAALNNGGYVVTWVSASSTRGFGIFGQLYSADGTATGLEFRINTNTEAVRYMPSVTNLDMGGFVVIWSDTYTGSWEIHGQRYAANNLAIGKEFTVNPTNISQENPSISHLNDGGFIVTWEHFNSANYPSDIYGQRFDIHGAKIGDQFAINDTKYIQTLPDVTTLVDGNFVVTWQSKNQDGDGLGIYGQRYDGNGVGLGSEFRASTYTVGDQAKPAVTSLADGGFVVTWQSQGQDGSGLGVYGQRYSSDGTAAGGEFRVNAYTDGNQSAPSVVGLNDGGFIVTYESGGQYRSDIYAQRFDAEGNRVELVTNALPTGDVIITGNPIKGQTLTASNTLADADGLGVITYQWQANGINLSTGDSYTLTSNEIGKTITAIAKYTDLLGTAESVSSAATTAVTEPLNLTQPKITLSPGLSPTEGTTGTYLITLDTPAPAGGLVVSYNTTGSTATLNDDYNFAAGESLTAVTDNSFTIAAGATTATLNLVAHADGVIDPKENVVVNLTAGTDYDLVGTTVQFAKQTKVRVNVTSLTKLISADFNRDGNADLVTVSNRYDYNDSGNPSDYTVSVLLSNGDGSFTEKTNFKINNGNTSVITSDFNDDGNADLAITSYDTLAPLLVRLGNGKGGFSSNTSIKVKIPILAISDDFNGDGNADLATLNISSGTWQNHEENTVSVLLSNGNGDFSNNTTITMNYIGLINSADVNGDGNADLLVSSSVPPISAGASAIYTVSLLLGNGSGEFIGNTTPVVSSLNAIESLSTADFNSDGKLDLVIEYNTVNNFNILVLLNNGRGGFNVNRTLNTGHRSVISGDFNGDGNADLAIANGSDNNVSVRLGNGNGWFTGKTTAYVNKPSFATAADFNGDGKLDLATANKDDNTVSILLNTTNTTTAKLTITDIAPPLNHPPLGTVTISDNTPEQNQILAATNTLTDTDGLGTITYSWFANDLSIGTGNNYTVTANEVGKTLAVTASYTDGLGKVESISSASTSAVTVPIAAGFNISPLTPQTTGENGATASYSIHLNTAPLLNQDVVITFASSDTSEGVINNPTLTFTSSNYATPQTLTVQGVDDYLGDGDISYQVTAQISSTDVFYKSLAINSFSLTNADDGLDKALDLYGDEGGSKIDVLIGGNGADKLHGLNMADDLSGGLGNDSLWGGYGDDNLHGNEGDDKLNGEQENDLMEGGTGNDTLDGGDGVDTMIGGEGNDTYYLGYDAMDVIDDKGLTTDVDTVIMPYQLSKYTLPTGIEQGTIATGTGVSSLTGNEGNNALTGNDGKNMLVGAVGRDSLFGGSGNDVLNGGTDDDVLEGGTGKDNLTGGAGKDYFLFDTALKSNVDKITDFNVTDDIIQLENQIFTKLKAIGTLNADNFVTGTTAVDSNDYLVYNKTSGALSYDADGSGTGAAIQIAMIGTNLSLTNADFVII